jgi:hypothetical protein
MNTPYGSAIPGKYIYDWDECIFGFKGNIYVAEK